MNNIYQSCDLKELEKHFDEKVQIFKNQYLRRLDDLRLENSQLRGRIIKLTEETSYYQSHINRINIQGIPRRVRLRTALKARNLANLSLVANPTTDLSSSNESSSRKGRCTSAPGTDRESRSVEVTALEQEVKELIRPHTTSYNYKQ